MTPPSISRPLLLATFLCLLGSVGCHKLLPSHYKSSEPAASVDTRDSDCRSEVCRGLCVPQCSGRQWGNDNGCGGICSCDEGGYRTVPHYEDDEREDEGGDCWFPEVGCLGVCDDERAECGALLPYGVLAAEGEDLPPCDCGSCPSGQSCDEQYHCCAATGGTCWDEPVDMIEVIDWETRQDYEVIEQHDK